MNLVHLTSSTLFGGPERQMLGLAEHLPKAVRTTFLSFREGGRCQAFLDRVRECGYAAVALAHDTPNLPAAIRELTGWFRSIPADLVLTHGYKANLLGRQAARRVGIPVVAVSRGWTGENAKVKLYEAADRWHLRFMDRVVAVSEGQAGKVRATGIDPRKVIVIRNSARLIDASADRATSRQRLKSFFPHPVDRIVVAAGRLSPEKGFHDLVDAARVIIDRLPRTGFLLFGEGGERDSLLARIRRGQLDHHFVLPGHVPALDPYLTGADLVVLPSLTEGLPNVALEASSAGVAVVATAVGGTPEAVVDGVTGRLVPPSDPNAIAHAVIDLLQNDERRTAMGNAGRLRMQQEFSFESQARSYLRLLEELGCCVSERKAA